MNRAWPCLALVLACGSCRSRSRDCGQDPACFAEALRTCQPGTTFMQGGANTGWKLVGYAGPDCHLVATSAGAETHCIFPSEIAQAWRQGAIPDPWRGEQADEACYAGDGGCVGIPMLAPLCVLGDCMAGRWTYTCELTPGGQVEQCEGTKAIDRAPADAGCWLRCENAKPKVDCWADRKGKPMIPYPLKR